MVTICITFVILLQMFVIVSMNICDGTDGKHCCQGFKWDLAQNKCITCDNGFKEINCDSKCPYPTYGQGCQSVCNCNVTYCDHVNGCTESSGDTSNVTADNTTNYHTTACDTRITKHKKIHSLMTAVNALTALSFIICMMYIYTRVLEKRQLNKGTF